VNTYVAASHTAQRGTPLDHNFRSRPCVIHAVNTLFQSAAAGALGEGIDFLPTQPGGRVADADLMIEQQPAPAIHFQVVPSRDNDKDWTKPLSVQLAADLCADAIGHLIQAIGGGWTG
jgi:exodeoxyribonuclease V beta subunit